MQLLLLSSIHYFVYMHLLDDVQESTAIVKIYLFFLDAIVR